MNYKNDKNKIMSMFKFVSTYAEKCDDWVHVKKEVMKQLPPRLRTYFSRRDQKTKNHSLNDFEKEMINYYKDLTHIKLIVRTLDERRKIFGKLHR